MREVIKAGSLYFGLVFAAGFVLGAVRMLALAPRVGDLAAVALELPVMLGLAWIACGWTLVWEPVRAGAPRAAMGAVAFVILMLAEAMLSTALGRTLAEHLATYATAAGLLGLAGQLAFAAFPLLRR